MKYNNDTMYDIILNVKSANNSNWSHRNKNYGHVAAHTHSLKQIIQKDKA